MSAAEPAAEAVAKLGSRTDPWTGLRAHTPARIALGRAGASLPTRALLEFGLAHARARDAVHAALDVAGLRAELEADGWPLRLAASAAPDRAAYLARPDWGRRLHADSDLSEPDPRSGRRSDLDSDSDSGPDSALDSRAAGPDLLLVLGDGLSAVAVQNHAAAVLRALRPLLAGLRLGPVVIATQARVALGDAIGERLRARLVAVLIGERPGLSSPDSLGIYLTLAPRVGCSDAERECISNVHAAGLSCAEAATQLAVRVREALRRGGTGVAIAAAVRPDRALES